jgi:hypothetical protein
MKRFKLKQSKFFESLVGESGRASQITQSRDERIRLLLVVTSLTSGRRLRWSWQPSRRTIDEARIIHIARTVSDLFRLCLKSVEDNQLLRVPGCIRRQFELMRHQCGIRAPCTLDERLSAFARMPLYHFSKYEAANLSTKPEIRYLLVRTASW